MGPDGFVPLTEVLKLRHIKKTLLGKNNDTEEIEKVVKESEKVVKDFEKDVKKTEKANKKKEELLQDKQVPSGSDKNLHGDQNSNNIFDNISVLRFKVVASLKCAC